MEFVFPIERSRDEHPLPRANRRGEEFAISKMKFRSVPFIFVALTLFSLLLLFFVFLFITPVRAQVQNYTERQRIDSDVCK